MNSVCLLIDHNVYFCKPQCASSHMLKFRATDNDHLNLHKKHYVMLRYDRTRRYNKLHHVVGSDKYIKTWESCMVRMSKVLKYGWRKGKLLAFQWSDASNR